VNDTLLLRGGTIVTVTDGVVHGDVYVEDGRIAAVGSAPAAADDVVDVRGMLVLPGFVQAHIHLCQTLLRGLADDLDVIDWLRLRVWPLEFAHDEASIAASAQLACAELLLGGTTSVLSMESVHHTDAVMEAVIASGLRATVGKALMDAWEPGTEMIGETTDAAWDDQLRLVERWHGSAAGRLRIAASPRGPRNATPELWRRCVELAGERDLVLHTHVAENRRQADLLGARPEGRDVVALAEWGALSPRMVMAHSIWLDASERALVRRHRPHVCHCPSANLKLASGIAPVPGYLDDGINVALGADGAACNNRLDAFTEMRLAALIQRPAHGPKALPAPTILEMATMGGARALGLGAEIGSIEVGKRADLVAIRRDRLHAVPVTGGDPVADVVYTHTADDVDAVWVDGNPAVIDGRLVTLDERTVRAEAEQQRGELLRRVSLGE
jgi:5-methylthioadenosine/S-adenosylhomocysteine deaminase